MSTTDYEKKYFKYKKKYLLQKYHIENKYGSGFLGFFEENYKLKTDKNYDDEIIKKYNNINIYISNGINDEIYYNFKKTDVSALELEKIEIMNINKKDNSSKMHKDVKMVLKSYYNKLLENKLMLSKKIYAVVNPIEKKTIILWMYIDRYIYIYINGIMKCIYIISIDDKNTIKLCYYVKGKERRDSYIENYKYIVA